MKENVQGKVSEENEESSKWINQRELDIISEDFWVCEWYG